MAIFVIVRIDEHKGTYSIVPLLLAGLISILYWRFFDDLKPYALVQFVHCIAIPLMFILLPPMYTHSTYWLWAAGFYLLTKVEEAADKPIYSWTHHIISGHSLKHLYAAMVHVFLTLVLAKKPFKLRGKNEVTLAATAGNNIGKVLQKKGTIILPPLSLKLKVIRAYAVNKPWALGFLMDIVGALLMLRALSLAPVSVVQPVSGCGLAILSVFSHFYLKEVMNVFDWIGITVAGIGTIGVGAGGEEQEASLISVFQLLWLALVVAILFVLLNAWLHIFKRQRREQELGEYEVVEEIIYGLESGILFGMASVVSKMGFVFVEQGFSAMFIPMCISISICCSGTGFFYQTRGLKHGRAIVVSTCAAVASIVTGVVAGMFALGEKLPTSPSGRLLLLLGWLLIMLGVVLLVTSSRLIRHLPRSFRRSSSRQTSLERGFNIRRTASHVSKDTNPSAVIQTATLHHLLSSPSKDKD